MDRRTYLGSLGIVGMTSIAGCLGITDNSDTGGKNSNTVLSPPDGKRGDPSYDPSYPSYGEEFPSFSIQDPLAGEAVSLEEFVGERAFLMTYIYTSCPDGACPMLLQYLRQVQEDAAKNGYADDVALLAMSFDPERDTADALQTFGGQIGVDYEAENFHFLRPESYETAKTLMRDTFGVPLEKTDEMPDGNGSTNQSQNESMDHDHGEYMFTHTSIVELVNDRGIVERAYPRANIQREAVNTNVVVEDTRTVVGVNE